MDEQRLCKRGESGGKVTTSNRKILDSIAWKSSGVLDGTSNHTKTISVRGMRVQLVANRIRDQNKPGLYNLNLWYSQKTVVYSTKLLQELDHIPPQAKDSLPSRIEVVSRGFGTSSRLPAKLAQVLPAFEAELKSNLEFQMPPITKNGLRRLEILVPSMISFLDNPIDQHFWERMSGTTVCENGQAVETGLL
jgi:hypothetical protein